MSPHLLFDLSVLTSPSVSLPSLTISLWMIPRSSWRLLISSISCSWRNFSEVGVTWLEMCSCWISFPARRYLCSGSVDSSSMKQAMWSWNSFPRGSSSSPPISVYSAKMESLGQKNHCRQIAPILGTHLLEKGTPVVRPLCYCRRTRGWSWLRRRWVDDSTLPPKRSTPHKPEKTMFELWKSCQDRHDTCRRTEQCIDSD